RPRGGHRPPAAGREAGVRAARRGGVPARRDRRDARRLGRHIEVAVAPGAAHAERYVAEQAMSIDTRRRGPAADDPLDAGDPLTEPIAAVPAEVPPPRNLWPAIEARIAAAPPARPGW